MSHPVRPSRSSQSLPEQTLSGRREKRVHGFPFGYRCPPSTLFPPFPYIIGRVAEVVYVPEEFLEFRVAAMA